MSRGHLKLIPDVGIKTMKKLTICLLLFAAPLAYAETDTNIYLKSGMFSSAGLTNNNYVEVFIGPYFNPYAS